MPSKSVINIFLLGILLSSLAVFPFILDFTLVPRFICITLCISVVLGYVYRLPATFNITADGVFIAYAAYTAFCAFSTIWSVARSEAIFESSKQIVGFFVFLFSYFSLKKHAGFFMKNLIRISALVFITLFLVILYQLKKLPDFNKEELYAVTGLNGHKNLLASFLFLNLLFLLMAVYKLSTGWKVAGSICVVLSLGTMLLLQTKAVWIGAVFTLVTGFVLYLLRKAKPLLQHKASFTISLLVFIFILNLFFIKLLQPLIQKSMGYTTEINTTIPKSPVNLRLEEERLILWNKTITLIKQKPLCGTGLGNWQTYFPNSTLTGLWRAEELGYTFQRPHNDFLWILSETGLIGFNLYLLFIGIVLLSGIKCLSVFKQKNIPTGELLLCIAFIVGYFTISFFDFPKERIEHTVWINIILGIVYFHIKSHHIIRDVTRFRIGSPVLFLSLLLMGFVLFTGMLRFRGEFFTRHLYSFKNTNRPLELVHAGHSAISFAYAIDPTSVPVYWYMGNAQAALGNYKEAHNLFLYAYQLAPYNRNVLNDLASSYVYNNNVIMAKQYYEEAARISPRFDEPKLNLAAMYINAGDFKTAEFWLNTLMHDSERRTNYSKIIEFGKNSHQP